ncbi:MAG: hypothetical protein IPN03_05925 [Holophagales bacterium]|nr:hypothetical protein [Holophagales bacterium]
MNEMGRTEKSAKSRSRSRSVGKSEGDQGKSSQMWAFREAFRAAGERPAEGTSTAKKNYAEQLSRNLAMLFANRLRSGFPEITPDEKGRRHERPARTAKGTKKLDVNYSHPDIGLGLGVTTRASTTSSERRLSTTTNASLGPSSWP